MLRATLLALAASLTAVAAVPMLSLHIGGPSSVQSIDTLDVVTIVKNIGNEPVKLLNHPRSPLSFSPTDIFSISNDRGDEPAFTGIEVRLATHIVNEENQLLTRCGV